MSDKAAVMTTASPKSVGIHAGTVTSQCRDMSYINRTRVLEYSEV